jgi:hypothetical protein
MLQSGIGGMNWPHMGLMRNAGNLAKHGREVWRAIPLPPNRKIART